MIQVGCIEQGNQHVDVEQVGQRLFPQLVHEIDVYPCPGSSGKHKHAVALLCLGGGFRRLQYQLSIFAFARASGSRFTVVRMEKW
jgi:hypothetical protein